MAELFCCANVANFKEHNGPPTKVTLSRLELSAKRTSRDSADRGNGEGVDEDEELRVLSLTASGVSVTHWYSITVIKCEKESQARQNKRDFTITLVSQSNAAKNDGNFDTIYRFTEELAAGIISRPLIQLKRWRNVSEITPLVDDMASYRTMRTRADPLNRSEIIFSINVQRG